MAIALVGVTISLDQARAMDLGNSSMVAICRRQKGYEKKAQLVTGILKRNNFSVTIAYQVREERKYALGGNPKNASRWMAMVLTEKASDAYALLKRELPKNSGIELISPEGDRNQRFNE